MPNIRACPSPTNLLEWHYALEGVKGTPYEGGVYHGCATACGHELAVFDVS